MSLPDAAGAAAPRHALRSAAAVLAGLVVIFVLSMGTDQILHSLGIYPPWGQPMSDGLYVVALAYRSMYAVIGCYLAARLAPYAPMGHALALGAIGVVLSTAGAIAMWDMGSNWFPALLVLSSLPLAWIGGALYRRHHAA